MKIKSLIAAIAVAIAGVAPVSATSTKAGTSGVTFLKFPVGARALAMGEAATATAQGAEALFWNPSRLGVDRSVDVILNHQPTLEFMNYDIGAAAWSNGMFSSGLGVARLTQENLDVLDLSGTKVRSAQAYDQQFAAGAAVGKNRWGAGLAVKYIQSKLDDVTASAVAGDVGFSFPGFFHNLSHAISVRNIGSTISYDTESYALPLTVRGGSALKFGNAILAVDVVKPNDANVYWAVGGEVPVLSTPGIRFKLRGGYRADQTDLGKLAGLSLGSGLEMAGFRLDYAWQPNGDFGDSHNISLGYRFTLSEPVPTKGHYERKESGRYRLPTIKGK